MSTTSTKRTVIVAAVDDTPAADEVLRTTLAAARGFDASEVHFINVAEPPIVGELQLVRLGTLVDEGRELLARIADRAREEYAGRVEGHLAVDLAPTGILQLATDLEADLIVVGTHNKRRLQRLVLGSVARAVVDRAHCAVLVARAPDYPTSNAPAIEPACHRCVEVQRASGGARLWCEEHSRRSLTPHLHYRVAQPFAVGSGLLRPTGSGL
ncbi:MAG: universal stress protein [Labilithrix sp.]|nr:universal stress protein [Labilithrix sp.]MCW5812534.1 universal stress protein [Labilithrix sp.]